MAGATLGHEFHGIGSEDGSERRQQFRACQFHSDEARHCVLGDGEPERILLTRCFEEQNTTTFENQSNTPVFGGYAWVKRMRDGIRLPHGDSGRQRQLHDRRHYHRECEAGIQFMADDAGCGFVEQCGAIGGEGRRMEQLWVNG